MKRFYFNPSCSLAEVARFEASSNFQLPSDYSSFLQITNGGEGYLSPQHFAIVWRLEELMDLNEAYQTRKYAPGLFLFGSNGGGEAFAFDRGANNCVVNVPFVGMDPSLVKFVCKSFSELVDRRHFMPGLVEGDAPGPKGLEILEINPVILGGSPTDPANKILVDRKKHIEAVNYWNKMIHDLRRGART